MVRAESDINIRSLRREIGRGDFTQTRRLGDFEVSQNELIGEGSVGLIFRAVTQGATVAIKLGLSSNPHAVAQYEYSAELQRRVAAETPHVPKVYESTTVEIDGHDGKKFPMTVMQYVKGETLGRNIAEKGTSGIDTVVRQLRPVAHALDAATGVLHRDVNPTNLVGGEDAYSLVDFDIACEEGETAPDNFIGTIGYAAPEQGIPDADLRAVDRFQFASTTLHAWTGGYLAGDDFKYAIALDQGSLGQYIQEQIKRTSNLPSEALPIMLQAHAPNPDDRYPTAAAFLDALSRKPKSIVIVDLHKGS